MKDISLVYMLGGLSSRFNGKAKAFAKVGPKGETLLEYSLNQALVNDFKKIIFIVSNKTEKQFMDHFGDSYNGIPILYALQEYDEKTRERPWGTNDALCAARCLIEGPFVICNGDDIYGEDAFKKLYNHLQENNHDATIGYVLGNVLSDKGTVNRGIFEEDDRFVKTVTENLEIDEGNLEERELTKEHLCSMNIFGLQRHTFNHLYDNLEQFKEENKGHPTIECYLPTELNNLISEDKSCMELYRTDGLWLGVTIPEDEEVVRKILADL